MNQALRVLRLLRELPHLRGRDSSTAGALAQDLDTCERTIYRDMDLLAEAGFSIRNDGAGYYLPATGQGLPVQLTASDLAALHYALEWLEEALPQALDFDADALLGKLAVAHGTADAQRGAGEEGLRIWPRAVDGPAASSNLAIAMKARREHRKLQGIYCSLESGQTAERTLHPYAVVYRGQAHYLVAYCEQRQGVRTFRLDRFSSLRVLPQRAEVDEEYDLEQHFSGAWEIVGGRKHTVRLRLTGAVARRLAEARIHPSQQVVRRTDEELELQFSVALTQEFTSWVLSLGGGVEVLAPQALRAEVCAQARQLLSNHGEAAGEA